MLSVEVGVGTARAILEPENLLNRHLMRGICTQCLRDLPVSRPSGSQPTFRGTLCRMKVLLMQKFLFLEPLAVRDRVACRVVQCMTVHTFIIFLR